MKILPESTSLAVTDTGPFALIPEWVLDLPISSTAVRLYAVLGRYADAGGECWPSRRTLAKRLNVSSLRTVDSALVELRDESAVVSLPRVDQETGQTSNRYFVRRVRPTAHPLAENCEGGVAADCEGPLAENCAQNESHAEREPVERETPPTPPVVSEAIRLMATREMEGEINQGRTIHHPDRWLKAKIASLGRYELSMGRLLERDPSLTSDRLISLVLNAGYRKAWENTHTEIGDVSDEAAS